jgi:hypothetical protein
MVCPSIMQVLDSSKGKQDYYDALEQLKHSYHKTVEIVQNIYDLGLKYGLSNEVIRKDIERALSDIIKPRQIRNLLPQQLKHLEKANKTVRQSLPHKDKIVFTARLSKMGERKIFINVPRAVDVSKVWGKDLNVTLALH